MGERGSQNKKGVLCFLLIDVRSTVKPGNKEQFDKEQIGIKEPFPVTNMPFTSYG